MVRKILCLSLTLFLGYTSWAQDQNFLAYVDKYKDIAIQEMERSGIPASIKLAQGILESNAGRSDLARRANNHFGIKCHKDWNGRTMYKKDDDYDENGKLQKSCFRVYKNAEKSYIAHSEFLLDPAKRWRYGFLFSLEPTDYRRWATGLKKAGYATSASYHTKLIDLIERYELFKYDQMVTNDILIADRPTAPVQGAILTNNDAKYVLAIANETISAVAERNDMSVSRLLDYNQHVRSVNEQLTEGTMIYLQPLRNSYRGRETWHQVSAGEKMLNISIKYGVKLSKLYKRNKMREGTEPAVGEKIKLKGGKISSRPKLRNPNEVLPEEDLEKLPIEVITAKEETPAPTQPERNPPSGKTNSQSTSSTGTAQWQPFEIVEKEEEEYIDFGDWEGKDPKSWGDPIFKPGVEPAGETTTADTTTAAQPQVTTVSQPATPKAIYHEVKKGDTLWNISKRYNTTVDAIKLLNDMGSNNIRLGERIRVK